MLPQLIAPWRHLIRTIILMWDDLLLWVFLSFIQGVAILLLLPAPAVAVGLSVVADLAAAEKAVNFDAFKSGVRQYLWQSYKVLGVWLLVLVLLAMNVLFYAYYTTGLVRYVTFVWTSLILIWFSFVLYLFPILLRMEDARLILIYRNAILLAFSQPLYTFNLLLIVILLLVLLFYIPALLFLVIPALLALLGNLGTRHLLAAIPDNPGQ